MRDVKIKPIKIEPIKTILLIGLASAVMGLSACNKSDSHKTAQTPDIASVSSEDVNIPEQITVQITEQGETPMTPHDQAGHEAASKLTKAETVIGDTSTKARTLLDCLKMQNQLEQETCTIDVLAKQKATIAAKKAQRAENAKTIAALDAELAENAKEKAAQEARLKALNAQIAAKRAQRAENAKAYAALKAENEQKRIRNDALLRDIARKAAQGSK